MDEIINVQGLWHAYPGGVAALRGIDISFARGEFVAIVGQNGSGKTTLVKHFNGLLKPTKGRVTVFGMDVAKETVAILSRKVGYCFQNPDHQIWAPTVQDEMAFGPMNLGFPKERVKQITSEILGQVGLRERADAMPFTLGKGQRQRLAVGAVLSMEPDVLIVDEPTTGQDWKESVALMRLLAKLKERNKTIIFITHQMKIVPQYAKRTVVMSNGQILMDGETTEIMAKREILEKASVRPPQIVRIAQALDLKERVLNVEEFVESFQLEYERRLEPGRREKEE